MARPIKDTPVISGKDLKRFYYWLDHPRKETPEQKEQAKKDYELVMSRTPKELKDEFERGF